MLVNSRKNIAKSFNSASAQEIIMKDIFQLRTAGALASVPKRNKISWNSTNPYNKRWQYKWKHAYYTYPKENHEHTYVKKPEDSKEGTPLFWYYWQDLFLRTWPSLKCFWERRHRMYDNFSLYFLPGVSVFMLQFTHLTPGFTILGALPWFLLYTRIRDKTLDPDLKETYLRDMLYSNKEISELFKEETIHVIDYDLEYDKGFPDAEKFPEYKNKLYRFFNTDTSMCTGFFKFGDVESGATMTLSMKTMPVPGPFRYQVGEPFYFYDLRAHIHHNGTYKEVVLVNENEVLKNLRPFLFLI
mmetsp:Transcript_59087/g.68367  ORF Transcript_59087/g.68367 Transcript_59087/m.68367 type:complete len:300 (-) Transcript_59087:216-1115(-)